MANLHTSLHVKLHFHSKNFKTSAEKKSIFVAVLGIYVYQSLS